MSKTIKNIKLNSRSKSCFLAMLFTCVSLCSNAQSTSKANLLSKLNKPKEKTEFVKYLKESSNELEATGAVLFWGYKTFLSSQDMASCVFSPSCSVYAIQSFQNESPFVAYVKVFDRLSRCHPFTAPKQYPFYKNTYLLYDPVH